MMHPPPFRPHSATPHRQLFARPAWILLGLSAAHSAGAATVLVDQGAPATALVPSIANGGSTLGTTWTGTDAPANAASWRTGTTGVGYEEVAAEYADLIGLDVIDMQSGNESVYVRIPFSVDDPAALASFKSLVLNMKYDDGFVAYLNGTEVASGNAPGRDGNNETLAWDSGATGNNSDSNAVNFEPFDITGHLGRLRQGENILAFHGLNNGLLSSDLLVLPQLVADDKAPPVWPELQFTQVASGLSRPVDIGLPGDRSGRLFVVEQPGRVRIFEPATGTVQSAATPFLDIQARVNSSGNERGLLGIAFPPGFPEVDHFYVNYTAANPSGSTVVARYKLSANDPDRADPNSEERILTVGQPFSNHNGGQILFGPDGYLYVGMGDGGSARDPGDEAQDGSTLLGKILRIDPENPPLLANTYTIPADNPFADNPSVRSEIWATGVRNPWRFSFDRLTGDLYIGDVGQGALEEINYQPASSTGGENYGWDYWEASQRQASFNSSAPPPQATLTFPVFEYGRSAATGGVSVTGGRIYRGPDYPRLFGVYLFADYGSGNLWGLRKDGDSGWHSRLLNSTNFDITAFGEDARGTIYFSSFTGGGTIYRIDGTRDRDFLRVFAAGRDGAGRFSFTFGTSAGSRFQMEMSTDLVTWTDIGAPMTAGGDTLTFEEPIDTPDQTRFFRARALD